MMNRSWVRVLLKAVFAAVVLVFLWALKDKDAIVVYMQF